MSELSIPPETSFAALSTASDAGNRLPVLHLGPTAPDHRLQIGARSVARRAPIPMARRRVVPETGYSLRVEKIGYQMFYGGHGAYLYQPIPKCACTAIKTLFIRLEGLPVDDNHWRRHQKEFNGFPGTNHLPIQEQLDIFEGRTDTFKFVFVRNPYARLASIYCDKILVNPAPYLIRQIRKSAAEQGTVLSDTITFAQFVSVVSRQSLAEMNTHCRPQYYEGRFGIVKFDFIGRTEAMSRDLTYALERIEAPESIIARVNERHNVAGSSMELWDTVPAEVKRQFLATYEIDFDLLQYSRELRQPADLSCRRDRFSQPGQSRVGRRRRRSSDAVCGKE